MASVEFLLLLQTLSNALGIRYKHVHAHTFITLYVLLSLSKVQAIYSGVGNLLIKKWITVHQLNLAKVM